MPHYTTGELAKLCGVSVRTVQYYDTRGILLPSELSQGGRRIYTEQDVRKLRVICFLRDAGLSLNSIAQLLSQETPGSVMLLLLEQQKQEVEAELADAQKKRDLLNDICKNLDAAEHFHWDDIGDIAYRMQGKKNLKKVRTVLLSTAIPLGLMEWTSIFLGFLQGVWWPFAIYTLLAVPYIMWIFRYHWNHVSYICPQCHSVFKPSKREAFFARHTFTTRKLTCTHCGQNGFCVETCVDAETVQKTTPLAKNNSPSS